MLNNSRGLFVLFLSLFYDYFSTIQHMQLNKVVIMNSNYLRTFKETVVAYFNVMH